MANKKQSRFTASIKLAYNSVRKAVFGEPAKQRASSIAINNNGSAFTLPQGQYEDWVREAYKENELVHGALNLIINTFCEGKLSIKDPVDGGNIDKHDLIDLIQHINPNDTHTRFLKQMLLDMFLGDVAYVEKVFDKRGRLTELGLLRPDKVLINSDPDNFITNYVYTVNNKRIELSPDEVIPIAFIDPSNRFGGFSPLKSLAKRITQDNKSTDHAVTTLDNGGQPGSVLTTAEELSQEQADAMAQSWQNKFSGDNNGKTAVLAAGMEYSPLGMSMKDLDFSGLTNIGEAKLLSTLRIPLQVYGSVTGSESSTFNNVSEARKQFWEQAIIPLHSIIEDAFNNDIHMSQDKSVVWFFDRSGIKALQEDEDALSLRNREDWVGGVITRNEAREARGLDPVEGGDVFIEQRQLPSVESEPVEDVKAVADWDSSVSKELISAFKELDKHEEDRFNKHLEQSRQSECGCCSHDKKEIDRETLSETDKFDFDIAIKREGLSNQFIFDVGIMMLFHFKAQVKDVLQIIGTKDMKIVKTFEVDRITRQLRELEDLWFEDLASKSNATLGRLVGLSAKDAALDVGANISIDSENIQKAISADTFKFAKKVSNTSAKQMRKIIQSAFTEGKSIKQLKTEISALGKQWQGARASTIARTETSRAANAGARIGYKESGVVTKLKYSAILDARTTEICEELDGKIVGIEEPFLTQAEGFVDSRGNAADLSYDGGVTNPPAHVNCRSTIIAVVEGFNN